MNIQDSISEHSISIEIRHSYNFAYRNLWLSVECSGPEGYTSNDLMNCELADASGEWFGSGISLRAQSFIYKSSIKYPRKGRYIYTIRHGMRNDVLHGISDIGLLVKSASEK
ncbi:hypothetical protein AwDysgo_12060 [Bacteroidales bacterium]|nr:hypothetical protein AwDysgo_12060 [Bacteroidales bacterium]